MKIYNNPARNDWGKIAKRPTIDEGALAKVIDNIFETVTKKGDDALISYTQDFDQIQLTKLSLNPEQVRCLAESVSTELRAAIDIAYKNIRAFHSAQLPTTTKYEEVETMPGVTCWRESRAIESIGLYIPGGSAPLISTVLMLGAPAQLADCKQITLCTPPDAGGQVNPAICYAALKVGISKIYCVGGAQAIAAMAIGTQSIPKVSKIFGPGNQYVTSAKMKAQSLGVTIDMPAGPSEVLVIADQTTSAAYAAADLLSQAEHGPDSQVVLVTTSSKVADAVIDEVKLQCGALPRAAIAEQALKKSICVIVRTIEEAIEFSNAYAPEHLILSVAKPEMLAKKVTNAGSVFLGHFSPESAGDYASGTNHSLPTNGWARSVSGVSVDSFIKKITFQTITQDGLKDLAPTIIKLAEAEGLEAHANAVKIRL